MFKLHVLDVTQILLWKVSGFLVSKQSTFLTYFQSSKCTEAKHSHITHVRNNLKYFSISCAQCECLINQRLWKWTKQTQKWVSLEDNNYRYYSNNSIPQLMRTRTKNTHMNIWEKRLNHTILFTIVKGLWQVYLSTEDMALEKSSILLFGANLTERVSPP